MRGEVEAGLEERLLRYVRIDTGSDPTSTTRPSTARQLDLSRLLVLELQALGAVEVRLTDYVRQRLRGEKRGHETLLTIPLPLPLPPPAPVLARGEGAAELARVPGFPG